MAQQLTIKQAYDSVVRDFNGLMNGTVTAINAPFIRECLLRTLEMIMRHGYTVGDINFRRRANIQKMYSYVEDFMRTGAVTTERFSSKV